MLPRPKPIFRKRPMHAYRTHTCAQLRATDVGNSIRLSGWVHRKRDHGNLLFVDLRDHYGITQIVTDVDSPAFKTLEGVRAESVIRGPRTSTGPCAGSPGASARRGRR